MQIGWYNESMISREHADRIMHNTPQSFMVGQIRADEKVEIERVGEDDNLYIYAIYVIPKSVELGKLSDEEKELKVFDYWEIDKETGLSDVRHYGASIFE